MSEPKFIFHTTKPKSVSLAHLFAAGCKNVGIDCVVTHDAVPRPDRIGVFYGVVPSTYAAFQFYRAEGRAIYLDNGWLSQPHLPTFRFSWNSAQPFVRDITEPMPGWAKKHGDLPTIDYRQMPGRALVVLQTPQYFEFMRLGINRDLWQKRIANRLIDFGYVVEFREKPSKKNPEDESLFDCMARAEIVVSLNSASCLKSLRYGIPSYCTLDCSLSPVAPTAFPVQGKAAPPDPYAVEDLCSRLARYELTKDQLRHGYAARIMLRVPKERRRGYWYGLG